MTIVKNVGHGVFLELIPNLVLQGLISNTLLTPIQQTIYSYSSFVIVALGIIAVIFPSQVSEKPLILLHVLLSFTFFQLLLADAHPASNTPPLLGLYIMASMTLAAFHLLTACLILRLHHLPKDSYPPNVIRVIFLRPLIRLSAGCRKLFRNFLHTHQVDLIEGA